MKLEYAKNGTTHSVTSFESLPEPSREYLIEYGFKQTMGDSHAGSFKRVESDWMDAAKAAGRVFDPKAADFLKAVNDQIDADCAKRLAKILDGTMSVRDSDPLRAIAVELLRKNAVEKGKKLPDGKTDEYRTLVASVLEKHRVAIQKEYDRRQKTTIAIEL